MNNIIYEGKEKKERRNAFKIKSMLEPDPKKRIKLNEIIEVLN